MSGNVHAKCAKCGEKILIQIGMLEDFPIDAVPRIAALSIAGTDTHCKKCGQYYAIIPLHPPLVKLRLDPYDPSEDLKL